MNLTEAKFRIEAIDSEFINEDEVREIHDELVRIGKEGNSQEECLMALMEAKKLRKAFEFLNS